MVFVKGRNIAVVGIIGEIVLHGRWRTMVTVRHRIHAAVVVVTCRHEKSDSACHSCHTSFLGHGSEKCGDIDRHRNNTSSQFACVSNEHFLDCRCVRASVWHVHGSPTTLRAAAQCPLRVCWPLPWLCLSSGDSKVTIQGVVVHYGEVCEKCTLG